MGERGEKTILLVEDEALVALDERQQLETRGYAVVTAASGEEAIVAIGGNEGIDLVLMDIDLGKGIDGVETARRIHRDRNVPVVFLSNHTEPELVGKTEDETFYGYVVKSSGIAVLEASIRMAFRLFEADRAAATTKGKLEATINMFQAVLDSMPQYICWKDKNSVFLGCNINHARLFNLLDTGEVIGKTDWDLHRNKEEIEKYISDDKAVMESDTARYHIVEKAHYPNGKQRWLETNKVPIHGVDGGVDGIMIAYSDITEKKKMEEALEREQYFLRTLMEMSPDHIYFKDRESRFLRMSKSQCSQFGCGELADMIGKTDFDFFTLEHAQAAYDDEQMIIKTGQTMIKEEKETWSDRPDSWTYSIKMPLRDKKGDIVGTFGISRDISELRKTQEALRISNERYHGIIERLSDYIFTAYLKDGKIVETNHGAACISVTGYTTEEFNADPYLWFDMILPEDRDSVNEHTRRLLSDHEVGAIEHRIRRKDGQVRWIRNTPVLHRDSDGKLASYDGIIVDITERKLAEDEVKRLLEEKELLLKEVHHRIKNNMSTISSLLNLQASSQSDPKVVKALDDAGSRIQSMMVLYDRLYRSTNFLSVNVKEYLPALVGEIMGNFPDSPQVKIETKIEEFELSSKALQPLGIIINEIITNIMKYAFKGRPGGTISLSASLRGKRAHIEIHDDGIGLPEGVDFKSSTGFGLTLISMLTQQLGGDIRMLRENGTKVVLEFEK
jgi:PAS domain S-box-containing protein